MPPGFQQQPPGIGVAGFRDRTSASLPPGRVLAGHQTEVGTDGIVGEPGPIALLDSQSVSSVQRDAAQSHQRVDDFRVLAGCRDFDDARVQTLQVRIKQFHQFKIHLVGILRTGLLEVLAMHPVQVRPVPSGGFRVAQSVAQQQGIEPLLGQLQ